MNKISLKKISNNVLNIQINSIEKLKSSFDKNFEEIIEFLAKIKGRIIITGIGKSAIIGMKVSATLNSTGTPSIFMHGSDALHGDLGAITKDDIVIMSKAIEIKDFMYLKDMGIKFIFDICDNKWRMGKDRKKNTE